jgi:glutathione S-transferase
MKLFYSPSACSLAANIALREAGLDFELEAVDLATKKTKRGDDYWKVNPKGYVPALQLDNGTVLTENIAVLPFIADHLPNKTLAPRPGTMDRYRFAEWLGFVATEVHKAYGPLWDKSTPASVVTAAKTKLTKRFAYLDKHLSTSTYLMGETFTVVDAYLFTVLRWAETFAIDLTSFGALRRYLKRVGARPSVKAALEAEARQAQRAA